MQLIMCKSKIHRTTITDADLNYEGSITIDSELMNAAEILPYEKVQVVNINNGSRIETYAIEGKKGSGVICLNGAAARKGQKGDKIIIISYGLLSKEEAKNHFPIIVKVNEHNKIISRKQEKELALNY
ncbi:MAG: aspartate 1-decarboxylase [Spirochaetota bacterium]|nr:aspartate 1-decarboxylase [Spirochaetota bacterium]